MSGGEPRLLFMALPPAAWVEDALRRLGELGIPEALGTTMFAPHNWHQSFSERIRNPRDADREAMQRVGDTVSAHACTLAFNRVEGPDPASDRSHCTMRARGVPKAFSHVLDEVRRRLVDAGLGEIATGVTPHMTLSYRAERPFATVPLDPPITWTIDTLCLVEGGGRPYRYDVLGRWALLPERDPPVVQGGLF